MKCLHLLCSEFEEEETNGGGRDYLQSPMSDGTIEEDFEEALAKVCLIRLKLFFFFNMMHNQEVAAAGELGSPATPQVESRGFEEENVEEFSDLAELGIVDVVGDDKGGRKIIVVSACKLPANKGFDNQRFLR